MKKKKRNQSHGRANINGWQYKLKWKTCSIQNTVRRFTAILYLINFNPLSYPAERLLKWTRFENILLHGKTQLPVLGPAVLLCDCHEFFNFIKVSFSGYLFSRQIFRTHSWWSEYLNWEFKQKKSRIMNVLHAENNYIQLA